MALPGNVTTKTVTGTFISMATGLLTDALVTFTVNLPTWLLDPAATTTIVPNTVTTFTISGFFSVVLPCTDDPDLQPNGWSYHCKIASGDLIVEFDFMLPSAGGGTVDLSQITPVVAPNLLVGQVKSVNGVFPDVNGNVSLATVPPTNFDNLADVNVPMPLDGDIVVYDSTTSQWIKSREVTRCTSITRPAAPHVGQMIYETDTLDFACCDTIGPITWRYFNTLQVVTNVTDVTAPYAGRTVMHAGSQTIWFWTGVQWQAQQTLGGKNYVTTTGLATTSGTTEILSGYNIAAVPLAANTLYWLEANLSFDTTVADDHYYWRFRDTNLAGAIIFQSAIPARLNGVPYVINIRCPYRTTAAVTKAFVVTVARAAGAGALMVRPYTAYCRIIRDSGTGIVTDS